MDIARKLPSTLDPRKPALPEFEIVVAGGRKKASQRSKKLKTVAIPVLPVRVATAGERGDRSMDLAQLTAESVIAAPVTWNPNPGTTSCLRVKGSSPSPALNDGDLVAIAAARWLLRLIDWAEVVGMARMKAHTEMSVPGGV